MNIKPDFSKEGMRGSLDDNKAFLIPLVVLTSAIFLFIIFVLPAILAFPSKKSERDVEIDRLNQIKEAKEILGKTDPARLDTQVETATAALPSEKDFELILNAISSAASKSNSVIDSYIFFNQPGVTQTKSKSSGAPFEIKIAGSVGQAVSFLKEIYKIYPISEASEISFKDGISKISISFYYKPFTSVSAEDVTLAREMSPPERKALSTISEWSAGNLDVVLPVFESTSSGTRTSPF